MTFNGIEYDSIFVLIDCFIKLVYYYLVYKIINVIWLIELLFRIFAQTGPLDNIISNKGNMFISKY